MKLKGKRFFGLFLALVLVAVQIPMMAAPVLAAESINASEVAAEMEQAGTTVWELTGDTELVMDQDLSLSQIIGTDYSLIVLGNGNTVSLSVNCPDEGAAAIQVGSLIVSDTGVTVNATAGNGSAIITAGAVSVVSGTVICDAATFGISANEVAVSKDGIINVGETISPVTGIRVNTGSYLQSDGSASIKATDEAIYSDGNIEVSGPDAILNAVVTNENSFGLASLSSVIFSGGLSTISAKEYGIFANNLEVIPGVVGVSAEVDGQTGELTAVHADTSITLQDGVIIRYPVRGKLDEAKQTVVGDDGNPVKEVLFTGGATFTGWEDTAGNTSDEGFTLVDFNEGWNVTLQKEDSIAAATGETIYIRIETPVGYYIVDNKVKLTDDYEIEVNYNGSYYYAEFQMLASDVKFTFTTAVETHNVAFETNGGSAVETQVVEYNKKASRPAPDPTYANHVFVNWYADEALTKVFDFSKPITQDTTVYAKWNDLYTVTFNTNDGHVPATETVESGKTVTKPDDPTRDGYEFGGWYKDTALTQAFDFSTPITEDLPLYAKWIRITYTVTAGNNGTWTRGSGLSYSITVKRSVNDEKCIDHFSSVMIGSTTLTEDTDYSVKSGSTIVTLTPSIMGRLTIGAHTIVIKFDDGQASAVVTVRTASPTVTPSGKGSGSTSTKSAATGVEDNMGLWTVILMLSAAAAITLIVRRKRG